MTLSPSRLLLATALLLPASVAIAQAAQPTDAQPSPGIAIEIRNGDALVASASLSMLVGGASPLSITTETDYTKSCVRNTASSVVSCERAKVKSGVEGIIRRQAANQYLIRIRNTELKRLENACFDGVCIQVPQTTVALQSFAVKFPEGSNRPLTFPLGTMRLIVQPLKP